MHNYALISNILPLILQSPFSSRQSDTGLRNKQGASFFGANVRKREPGNSSPGRMKAVCVVASENCSERRFAGDSDPTHPRVSLTGRTVMLSGLGPRARDATSSSESSHFSTHSDLAMHLPVALVDYYGVRGTSVALPAVDDTK